MNKKQSKSTKIFLGKDRRFLEERGISASQASQQMQSLQKGFDFVRLARPCVAGDGIFRLNADEQRAAVKEFEKNISRKTVLKFVPASGAASRMFQFLEDQDPKHAVAKKMFLKELPRFAFYPALTAVLKKRGQDISKLKKEKKLELIVQALLEPWGLGYRSAPKGMILFHGRNKAAKTAFEEQLAEVRIFANKRKQAKIHFTVPVEAQASVRAHLKNAAKQIKGLRLTISDSVQSPATDCMALEKNGKPARKNDGQLLLRPSGHGALLENINKVRVEAIYVKNIDNILPAEKRAEADRWKKILSGVFFDVQAKVFETQKILRGGKITPEQLLAALKLAARLGWDMQEAGRHGARKSLEHFFNRPLRVCGMVRNTGEPGGGPFWIQNKKGAISPQIVESAEVDLKNPEQARIFKAATHFNPVDFICGVYDSQGKKYNLPDFRDDERGLIAQKNYVGRTIRVMELPGLWNGGMGDWLTVFVEIPGAVFAPVKTVLDLLRKEHQSKK